MTAGPVAQGGTLTLTAFFRTGTGTLVDPVTPLVSIMDPAGNVVVANAVPTRESVGTFTYNYVVSLGATIGSWSAHWTGSIGGSPEEADESFMVVPAGTIDVGNTCCGPWFDPADADCLAALDPADQELIALAVSELLYNASARVFTGVCQETIRPCDANAPGGYGTGSRLGDGSLWLGIDGTSALPEITWAGFGGVRRGVSGGLTEVSAVDLWEIGSPVVDILNVTINGTTLDPSEYSIVDDRWIIRNAGKCWPLWQRLDLPAGSEGTWSITFTFGVPIPQAGILAARVLACEMAKAPAFLNDESCRLPRRIQTITRENVTSVVIDPMKWTTDGKFGIFEVDTFIHGVNPYGISRDAKVLNPDLLATMPRRLR